MVTLMKKLIFLMALINSLLFTDAQNIINLPFETNGAVTWNEDEKEYYTDIWNTKVVTNVSVPTLEVFKPSKKEQNGAAVIIAPGGGLFALAIEKEGNEAARWLVEKGITAFVLKYRLVPTGEDGVAEISALSSTRPEKLFEEVSKVIPLSIEDGLNAITHVRSNAGSYGVDPTKIGFMGFSAGGAVAMGVAYHYTEESRPDFLAPVYAWTPVMPVRTPKEDAPPILIVCASDDNLGLAPGSIEIYNSWLKQDLSAELHMYSKGSHGFGMMKQGLPSDEWIERFYDWSIAEGLVVAK